MLMYQRFEDLSVADTMTSSRGEEYQSIPWLQKIVHWLRTRVADSYSRETVSRVYRNRNNMSPLSLFLLQWRHGAHIPYFYVGHNGPLITCGLHGNMSNLISVFTVITWFQGKYRLSVSLFVFLLFWHIFILSTIWLLINTD